MGESLWSAVSLLFRYLRVFVAQDWESDDIEMQDVEPSSETAAEDSSKRRDLVSA